MLQTSLIEPSYTTNYTFETSSTPQQLLPSLRQWDQSANPICGASWYEMIDDQSDLLSMRRINATTSDLNERTSFGIFHITCADRAKLTLREEGLRNLQRTHRAELEETFRQKLRQISYRGVDWDDKGSMKPNPMALSKASIILENFLFAIIESGRLWRQPFISSDEDGHITIEWENGLHELHIEISEDTEEYLKIWGINIEHEMHLDFLHPSEYVELWDWLY